MSSAGSQRPWQTHQCAPVSPDPNQKTEDSPLPTEVPSGAAAEPLSQLLQQLASSKSEFGSGRHPRHACAHTAEAAHANQFFPTLPKTETQAVDVPCEAAVQAAFLLTGCLPLTQKLQMSCWTLCSQKLQFMLKHERRRARRTAEVRCLTTYTLLPISSSTPKRGRQGRRLPASSITGAGRWH